MQTLHLPVTHREVITTSRLTDATHIPDLIKQAAAKLLNPPIRLRAGTITTAQA
ncbi:hypothetical protein [Frankia sp. Cppng1_Ct_nod]|uniref:hypothetical protein n=1 Tax=Frankia sp. Cppng1_Ct_nod TaxID=2897162 RepID=UPI0013EF98AA|nr:hypothetical protein [Frankia sp. Cppng1_Ct_nod]